MINKYTRKPITVEAVQWTGDNIDEVKEFIGEHSAKELTFINGDYWMLYKSSPYAGCASKERLDRGEWIIKHSNGGTSPCKTDIFAETYDAYDAEKLKYDYHAGFNAGYKKGCNEGRNND